MGLLYQEFSLRVLTSTILPPPPHITHQHIQRTHAGQTTIIIRKLLRCMLLIGPTTASPTVTSSSTNGRIRSGNGKLQSNQFFLESVPFVVKAINHVTQFMSREMFERDVREKMAHEKDESSVEGVKVLASQPGRRIKPTVHGSSCQSAIDSLEDVFCQGTRFQCPPSTACFENNRPPAVKRVVNHYRGER